MHRRDFMKFTALTGTSATLASCGSPEHRLMRLVPDEDLVPGVSAWKPSICPLCPAGCGVLVRVMEGDAEVVRNGKRGLMNMGLAKKIEGNPAHPVNQGKLCVRGQAAIQVTYHPDRITTPLKRAGERGSKQYKEISWDDALAELVSRLDALAAEKNQKSLAFLTRPVRGQRQTLIAEFLNRFGAGPPITFEVFGEHILREANRRSFGRHQVPTIDLARSRYVIVFGADFLGTWNSPVSQTVGYGQMRQGAPGRRAKLVQVEPRMSQTGANADEWVPARPGTEGLLALSLAHVIINAKMRPPQAAGRAGAMIEGWSGGLEAFSPHKVEKLTGVEAARIERLAREFAGHGPAVAVVGGAPLAHTNGMFNALAVNALNALVGSVEQPGGVFFTPRPNLSTNGSGRDELQQRARSMGRLAAEILRAERSPVELLLVYGANPVFGTPAAWRVKEALLRIPYIVSMGNFLDETSILADLILPDHSFLESWVDDVPESGTTVAMASVAPPAMRPLHLTRAMPDVLLEAGRRLRRPLSPPFPWQSYEEMLQALFVALPSQTASQSELPSDVWTKAQEQGGWWTGIPTRIEAPPAPTPRPVAAAGPEFDGLAREFPLYFLPYASQAFLDGSLAHLPWLQELPDVLSTAMWSSWIEINPQTAARLGFDQGDLIEVTSSQGKLLAPALLSPGIAPDVIAMPVGQGHQTYGRYASGRGANPISILAPLVEPETEALAWAATRVRAEKANGKGDLILFAGGMREYEHRHR